MTARAAQIDNRGARHHTSFVSRRVFVAIDLSDPSTAALRAATAYASEPGSRLAVCHVVPEPFGLGPPIPGLEPSMLADFAPVEAKIRESLTSHVSSVIGANRAEIIVERGVEYARIVQRAEEWQADLLVVGSHGRSGLSRLLMGSVAEQVVRHAHGSVLVVRPGPQDGPVLVATDLSDPSLPAVEAGAVEAKRRGVSLVVLHVIDFTAAAITMTAGSPFGAIGAMPTAEAQSAMRDGLRIMLGDALKRFGAEGEARVADGASAPSIVHEAKELGAQLLVVGTRGRTGLKRLALGSVAERVIREAPCPVLAVRTQR